jgi:hypothetical protein
MILGLNFVLWDMILGLNFVLTEQSIQDSTEMDLVDINLWG